MFEFFSIEPLNFIAIFTAILCGAIIGFERQWSGKPAGIRTSILICLSAYVFVTVGHYYQPEIGSIRIVGQIVTGVGFLGAGVIIAKEGLVVGVTSAAVIWILAAIGSLIGFGNYQAAIVLTIISALILGGMYIVEKFSKRLKRGSYNNQKKKSTKPNQENKYKQ